MSKEKEVLRIVVEYDDGTNREVTKGLVSTMEYTEGNTAEITAECVGLSGREFSDFIYGLSKLGVDLGILSAKGEE